MACNVCGRSYENSNSLKNDLRSHFDDSSNNIFCHVCGKNLSLRKLKHLQSHEERQEKEKKSVKVYSCRYCGLNFDKLNNRSSHERIHKDKLKKGIDDNFKCAVCCSIFLTQEELREHSFKHFSGKIHYCDFPGCIRYFKKGKLLTIHKRCHFEPQVKCLECGQMFKQRAGLLKHQKHNRCPLKKPSSLTSTAEEAESFARMAREQLITLSGRLSTTQSACEEELIRFENYYEVINDELEFNLIVAEPKKENEDWQYEYLDEAVSRSSQTNEEETNPFEVIEELNDVYEICEISCREDNFKNARRKEFPPSYECDFCCKQFSSRNSIITHLITHKTIADYDCTECSQTFKTQGNLSRHFRNMHINSKNWACEKCGKMFREKFQLDIHMPNHDKPSKCNECGKMVANIKIHMRHHKSKRNNIMVECPICKKKIQKYLLLRHTRGVHDKQYSMERAKKNLKVYCCKECGKFFSKRQELRQHEYISHTPDEKIYKCLICGTVFRKLKLFNVHRFTHEPLNVKCEICNKVYARKAALYKHNKKHHPELINSKKNLLLKEKA